jgi:hypothetical protein
MAVKSDLIDLVMILVHETDKAVLVCLDEDGKRGVWLPKSAIELSDDRTKTRQVTVTLSEALAQEKGLI